MAIENVVDDRSIAEIFNDAVGRNEPKPVWFNDLHKARLRELPFETDLSEWLKVNELVLTDRMVDAGFSETNTECIINYLKKAATGRIIGREANLKNDKGKLFVGDLRILRVEQLRFVEGLSFGYRADIVKEMIG